MRSRLRNILYLVLALSLIPLSQGKAQPASQSAAEIDSGDVVCQPGIYLEAPSDCMALGPSSYLTELAQQGVTFPLQTAPAYRPSADLNTIPYVYFQVEERGTPLYSSLDAAVAKDKSGRILGPGFVYISYRDRVDTGNGVFYMLPSGEWIAGAGSRRSPHTFQGVLLSRPPRHAFGWVLEETRSRRQPDFRGDTPVVSTYYRFNRVEIYQVQVIEGTEWYMIGRDEWLEGRQVAGVFPNTTPQEGVANGRWIEVNLAEQTLAVYQDRQLVFATLISSGVDPFWTRPGLFQIYSKKPTETMSGSFEADRSDYYYLEDVPWTMYFDKARALHGSYWHTYFGYPQSHGCVNLSIGDARWLFDWAQEGDWVWVHDPSGRTPTDPAFYGDGGA